MTDPPPHRRVRSFVRRPGRITVGQRRALDELLPRHGVPYRPTALDLVALFGRDSPRVLDIGFGDGHALVTTAARYPNIDYLGVEVHEPGVGHLLVLLERARLTNVKVIVRDAVDVVADMLSNAGFDAVNLFFPDPWPKKRHHKRRIVQPDFVASVARILKPGGLFHVATDWADYAGEIETLMAATPCFAPLGPDGVDTALAYRPPTKFEARGLGLGHEIADFFYTRRPEPTASDPLGRG